MLAVLCADEYRQGFSVQADPLATAASGCAAGCRGRAVESPGPLQAWPRCSSSGRSSRPSATRRRGRSRSTRWTATPSPSSVSCWLIRATRSVASRWRRVPRNSILIIRGGTGMPMPTTPTARATTAARSRSRARSTCLATSARTSMTAAACGQLGEREAAGRALRDLLALRPDFAAIVRQEAREVVGPGARRAPY